MPNISSVGGAYGQHEGAASSRHQDNGCAHSERSINNSNWGRLRLMHSFTSQRALAETDYSGHLTRSAVFLSCIILAEQRSTHQAYSLFHHLQHRSCSLRQPHGAATERFPLAACHHLQTCTPSLTHVHTRACIHTHASIRAGIHTHACIHTCVYTCSCTIVTVMTWCSVGGGAAAEAWFAA